jgi:5-methylcytosine-specific restriction endonuclease McrA
MARQKTRRPLTDEQRVHRSAAHKAWRAAHPDYHKTRYAAHREEMLAYDRAWRKAHPRSQGYVGTPNEEERRAYRKAANKKSREAHLEERRAYDRLYTQKRRQERPEYMAALKEASRQRHMETQWVFIKESYGHRCAYCSRKMARLTQDHITPLIQGGKHTASNIVPACQSCNAKKHTRPPLKAVQPILPFAVIPPRSGA